jgi:hypothetical protein
VLALALAALIASAMSAARNAEMAGQTQLPARSAAVGSSLGSANLSGPTMVVFEGR